MLTFGSSKPDDEQPKKLKKAIKPKEKHQAIQNTDYINHTYYPDEYQYHYQNDNEYLITRFMNDIAPFPPTIM